MKRPLPILGEASDAQAPDPVHVKLGEVVVRVADAHDGTAARRFAELLTEAGGTILAEGSDAPKLTIAIRSTPQSPEARLRAEVLEESADIVLGSAREAFAKALCERLGG